MDRHSGGFGTPAGIYERTMPLVSPEAQGRNVHFIPPYSYNFSPFSSPSLLPRQEADDPLVSITQQLFISKGSFSITFSDNIFFSFFFIQEPNLRGYQLLGDSQLLRFAKQILGKTQRSSGKLRYKNLGIRNLFANLFFAFQVA